MSVHIFKAILQKTTIILKNVMLQSNKNKVETSYLFVTKVFENSLIFKPNFKLGKPEKCSCCL